MRTGYLLGVILKAAAVTVGVLFPIAAVAWWLAGRSAEPLEFPRRSVRHFR